MNKRILKLFNDAGFHQPEMERLGIEHKFQKFAELIVKECNQAVLEVPCYYKDYRAQIEEAVINDCARAVLEHFGVIE